MSTRKFRKLDHPDGSAAGRGAGTIREEIHLETPPGHWNVFANTLSDDPSLSNGPSYHPYGLPLTTNLIEMVTTNTAVAGGRHAGLPVGVV